MWFPIYYGTDVADVVFNINPTSKTPECWQDNGGEWNCYERYKPRFCNDRYECSWDTPILNTINENCYDDHDNLQWICDSWEFYNVTKDSPGCVKVDGVGGIGGLTVSTGLVNYLKSRLKWSFAPFFIDITLGFVAYVSVGLSFSYDVR